MTTVAAIDIGTRQRATHERCASARARASSDCGPAATARRAAARMRSSIAAGGSSVAASR